MKYAVMGSGLSKVIQLYTPKLQCFWVIQISYVLHDWAVENCHEIKSHIESNTPKPDVAYKIQPTEYAHGLRFLMSCCD